MVAAQALERGEPARAVRAFGEIVHPPARHAFGRAPLGKPDAVVDERSGLGPGSDELQAESQKPELSASIFRNLVDTRRVEPGLGPDARPGLAVPPKGPGEAAAAGDPAAAFAVFGQASDHPQRRTLDGRHVLERAVGVANEDARTGAHPDIPVAGLEDHIDVVAFGEVGGPPAPPAWGGSAEEEEPLLVSHPQIAVGPGTDKARVYQGRRHGRQQGPPAVATYPYLA